MIDKVVFAVLAPGLAAGVLALLAWQPWRKRPSRPGGSWPGAVAVVGSFVASFVVVVGWPRIPPASLWHWVIAIVIAGGVVAILPDLLKPLRRLRRLAPIVAGAAAAGLFVPPPSVESPWVWRGVLGLAVAALGLLLEPLAARRPGASMPLGLCIWVAGASVLVTEAGIATAGLIVAASSAALGSIVIVAWLRPSLDASGGTTVTVATLAPAALAVGWLWTRDFTHVTPASFVLVAAAPVGLWLGELTVVTRRRAWVAALLRAVLVAVPIAIAMILATIGAADDPYG
ncbi:MAG: hypothetical protein ACYTGG_11295 [Planctomycetota bacterium]|jgi:hypothetical protein